MYRFTLVLPAFLLLAFALSAQEQPKATNSTSTEQKSRNYSDIPVSAVKELNPVRSSSESLAHARKWWTLDCAMCHGKDGDGKGDTARDMQLTLLDFTNPATLKDHTDGELYYVIKNGHGAMPPEGDRIKTAEGWDLVNYVRSLTKKRGETEAKSDSETKPR